MNIIKGKMICLLLIFFISRQFIYAQKDTLISYNVKTKQTYIYKPIIGDTSKVFDHTMWNYGIEVGKGLLPLTLPSNTFNNSGFTGLVPAQSKFFINDYPVRTAVKIFVVKDGIIKQRCSGIMVGKNYVLTVTANIDYTSDKILIASNKNDSILH
jgi:hypothetical protein